MSTEALEIVVEKEPITPVYSGADVEPKDLPSYRFVRLRHPWNYVVCPSCWQCAARVLLKDCPCPVVQP